MANNIYNVWMRVELDTGNVLEIPFENSSDDWQLLPHWFWKDGVIRLKTDHFLYSKLVPDQPRFVWDGQRLTRFAVTTEIQPGCIVVVLESPHKREYHPIGYYKQFRPRGPLMKDAAVENQLPTLLKTLGIDGTRQVVLCNPIQFQTSLHRVKYPDPDGGCVHAGIRNAVWKRLWTFTSDDELIFQRHFYARLLKYDPCLVINAGTFALRPEVQPLLRWLACPVVLANEHASVWTDQTQFTVDPAGHAWAWLPNEARQVVKQIGWLNCKTDQAARLLMAATWTAIGSPSATLWTNLLHSLKQYRLAEGGSWRDEWTVGFLRWVADHARD